MHSYLIKMYYIVHIFMKNKVKVIVYFTVVFVLLKEYLTRFNDLGLYLNMLDLLNE